MSIDPEGPGPLRAGGKRRRAPMRLSPTSLVRTGSLPGAEGFPLLVEPQVADIDPAGWAASERAWIEERLTAVGAILFRGFHVPDAPAFAAFARALSHELLGYVERAAPRREVAPGVFTSTEFAADHSIPLHHEMSYSHNWPSRLWFYCEQTPASGGATPIASEREVTRRIDPDIKARFIEKRVMYVRNYGEGVDIPWQEAFQTRDRAEVESYCRSCGMSFEWREGDRLRTRAVRQVMVTHPRTGDALWFNHAPIFHETNLDPDVREALRSQFAPDEMPRNAFYGDGSPIEPELLDRIRCTYTDAAVRFPWQRGDILMVDNFLSVHGRDPFEGPRSILVAMAELYTNPDAPAPA